MNFTQQDFNTLREQVRASGSTDIRERIRRLRSMEGWILSNLPDIREALFQDLGKPDIEAEMTEAFGVLTEIRHAIANLPRWAADRRVETPLTMIGTQAWSRQEPKGLCLLIGPWNFPFLLMAGPLVSALAAGNVVVLKPSEFAPATARLIARMTEEALPSGVARVVQGDKDIAAALTRLPFDHIFFTGSSAVGRLVYQAAADNLVPVTLELGGQCPAIVTADADLRDAARKIAASKFFNCGQTCIAPDHVQVDAQVFDRFLDLLREQATALFGESAHIEQSSAYGRIIHEQHANRLGDLLNDALASGAVLRYGGTVRPESRFIAPTIITDTRPSMRIRQEEIFGPVLPVERFESLDTVLAEYRRLPAPLAAYAFTRKRITFEHIRNGLSSGALLWNDCAIHFLHPGLPFGGRGQSGLGRSHGHAGFLEFSSQRSVQRQRIGWTGIRLFYPPYTPWTRRLARLLLRWF
jgi:aldehyde dehydrogenase (NAD+)